MSRPPSRRPPPPPLQLPTPDSSTTTLALPSLDSSTTLNDSYFNSSTISLANTEASSPFFSHPVYKQWQHNSPARNELKNWMRSPSDPLLPFPLAARGSEKLEVAMIREAEEMRRARYIEELRTATLLEAGEEAVSSYTTAIITPPASPIMSRNHTFFNDEDDDDVITMEDCRPLWYYIQELRSDLRELEEEEEKKERRTQHRNFSLFMAPGSPARSFSSDSDRLSWITDGRGIYTVNRFSNISAVSTGFPRFAITRTTEKTDLAGNRISTPPLAWESIFGEKWRASTPPVRAAQSSRVITHERPMTPQRFERPITPISPLERSISFSRVDLFPPPPSNAPKLFESFSSPTLFAPRPITLNLFERSASPDYFKPEPLRRAATTPEPPRRQSSPEPFERPLTPTSQIECYPTPTSPTDRSTTPTSPLAPPIALRKSIEDVGFISAVDIAYNRPVIGRDARGFFVPPPPRPPMGPPETFSAMDIIRLADEEEKYRSKVKHLFRSRTTRAPVSPRKENRRPSISFEEQREGRRSIEKQRPRRPSAVGSLDTVEEDEEKRVSVGSSSYLDGDEKERKRSKWGSGGERLLERAKKISWGKAMGSMSKRSK